MLNTRWALFFYIPCGNVNTFLISSSVHGHDLFQVRYINMKIDKDMDMGTNTNMNTNMNIHKERRHLVFPSWMLKFIVAGLHRMFTDRPQIE
jgi:hypothetical protein